MVGKENLQADALSRKYNYSLASTKEQDFIPQSINTTEDNNEPRDTSIATNNLSVSSVPEEFIIVSHGCINFKDTNYYYTKCTGHDKSLSHNPSCPYLDDENDEDCDDYN